MEEQPLHMNLNPHYRGRVRSGCLSCRTKKVKCDEQKPVCKRCTRLQRECTYHAKPRRRARGVSPNSEHNLQHGHQVHLNRQLADGVHEQLFPAGHPSETRRQGLSSTNNSTTSPASVCDHAQTHTSPLFNSADLSLMTSQDIYLCTTIDWLAAKKHQETVSFAYFLGEVEVPLVSPFDHENWVEMKVLAVSLSSENKAMATTISAVQILWRAHSHSLPIKNAVAQYEVAKRLLVEALCQESVDFSTVLLNAFLLSMFSIVLMDETDCIFALSDGLFLERMTMWSQSGSWTRITSRIAAWLEIVHAAARRGGNQGFMSTKMHNLLLGQSDQLSNPSATAATGQTLLGAEIFGFYLSLQHVSAQVANLSHYHRSRTTAADQEEVGRLMAGLKSRLRSLWSTRPAIMRCSFDSIRSQYLSPMADTLIHQAAVSLAAYHAEQLDIDRSMGDPLMLSPEADEGLHRIKRLVDGCKHGTGHKAGFLRPLFLYAIESKNPYQAQWAIDRMKEIRDPIARSDFFTSYAEVLVAEQQIKKRRVTTRWLCFERYGVRPPFL